MQTRKRIKGSIFAVLTALASLSVPIVADCKDSLSNTLSDNGVDFLLGGLIGVAIGTLATSIRVFGGLKRTSRREA